METTIKIDQTNKDHAIKLHQFATNLLAQHGVKTGKNTEDDISARLPGKPVITKAKKNDDETFGDAENEDGGIEFGEAEQEVDEISDSVITKAFKAYATENSKTEAIAILKKFGAKKPSDIVQAKRAKAMAAVEA